MDPSMKHIQFWIDALNKPNLDQDTINLLNKCLQAEIHRHMQQEEAEK